MSMMGDPGGAPPPGGDPSAPDPAAILSAIRSLLDQYIGLGRQTPVYHEARTLAAAIDAKAGGQGPGMGAAFGGPPPGPPPPGAGPPPGGPAGGPPPAGPDLLAAAGAEPPPNQGAKSYKDANVSALDRLKKRNAKSGSKA